LESGPDCRGCTINTVKRLHLRETSEAANQNPVIEDFRVSGERSGKTTVTLQVDVSDPERYDDPTTGARVTEEYLYTWYSSAGETDPALTFGEVNSTKLKLSETDPSATVMVAVRDGRGGLAVSSLSIER
jgi:hypothetical protein